MKEPIGSGRTTSEEGISWVTGPGREAELSTNTAGIAIEIGIFTITMNMTTIAVADVNTGMDMRTGTATSTETMTRFERWVQFFRYTAVESLFGMGCGRRVSPRLP